MNGQLRAIVWKEWREHLPIFWFLVAAAVLAAVITLILPADSGEVPSACGAYAFLYATPIVAVALGAQLASAERSEGTHAFLQSIPASLKQVAAVKLGFASAVLLLMTVGFFCLLALTVWVDSAREGTSFGSSFQSVISELDSNVESGYAWWTVPVAFAALGLSFLIWTAGVAVNSADVGRAAARGVVASAVAWCALWCADSVLDGVGLWRVGGCLLPGGFWGMLDPCSPSFSEIAPGASLAVVANVLLAARFVWCFGVVEETATWSPQPARDARRGWLGAPRASTWTALLWKHARTVAPGVVGAILFLFGWQVICWNGHALADQGGFGLSLLWPLILNTVLGGAAAMVVWVNAPAKDLGKGIVEFWRSRPVDAGQWYWTYCAANLFPLAIVIGLLIGLVQICVALTGIPIILHEVHSVTALIVAAFASATLAGCLMRRTDFAALMSLVLLVATAWVALWTCNKLTPTGDPGVLLLSLAAVMLLLGWVAVRNDWSIDRLG